MTPSQRQKTLATIEARLLAQVTATSAEALADNAIALTKAIKASDEAIRKANLIAQWSNKVNEEQIAVSYRTPAKRNVSFAVFGAFTLALGIAIVRTLLTGPGGVA